MPTYLSDLQVWFLYCAARLVELGACDGDRERCDAIVRRHVEQDPQLCHLAPERAAETIVTGELQGAS